MVAHSNAGGQSTPGCGLGPWRPRYLQIFAKPIVFLIVLNIYCLVEGAIVSGKVIQNIVYCGIRKCAGHGFSIITPDHEVLLLNNNSIWRICFDICKVQLQDFLFC